MADFHSNTTNVKVKLFYFAKDFTRICHSNTTNVKVKLRI